MQVERTRSFHLPAVVFAGLLFLIGASPAVATEAPAPAGSSPGPEVCAGCHQDRVDYFEQSVHGQTADPRTPANNGACAKCHGDGTEHVKQGGGRGVGGIKNPGSKLMSAGEKNEICLSCHRGGSTRTHWDTSTHAARGNACTSCHTLHSPDKVLNKVTQPQVCFNCHKNQRIEINRPSHHPIAEGKMACSDCHNPHGSIGRALMKRDSVVETCYQCHAEKRGPFVHPHDPVTEDCSLCHNPHGTVTDSMLKVRPPFLCQQCHTPHGAFIAQARGQGQVGSLGGKSAVNVTQARGCVNCHTEVHGSNNPTTTTPTPQFMFR